MKTSIQHTQTRQDKDDNNNTGPFQGHPNLKKSWSTVIYLCGDVLSKHILSSYSSLFFSLLFSYQCQFIRKSLPPSRQLNWFCKFIFLNISKPLWYTSILSHTPKKCFLFSKTLQEVHVKSIPKRIVEGLE